jgi:hypothetical protein
LADSSPQAGKHLQVDIAVSTERVETITVDLDLVALFVEVVSPSTKKTDRLEKPAAGVPNSTTSQTRASTIYCYRLDGRTRSASSKRTSPMARFHQRWVSNQSSTGRGRRWNSK